MKLTRAERSRILGGDHSALKRAERPKVKEGDIHVLIWSPANTVVTDRHRGTTITYPRRPLVWVEYDEPVRRRTGGWLVGIDFHDQRVRTRFLAAGTPGLPQRPGLHTRQQKPKPKGKDRPKLTDETAHGYTSSAHAAIDRAEAVDDDELRRQKVKSRERWSDHREDQAAEEEARRQERALRERIKEAVAELGPVAARPLLAAIEREITQAIEEQNSQDPGDRSTLDDRRTR